MGRIVYIHKTSCSVSRKKKNVPVFDVERNYDVALISAWFGGMELINSLKTKFVHRVDGLRSVYGKADETDLLQKQINQKSSFTIFQSAFCISTGKRVFDTSKPHETILNGTDLSLFRPKRKKKLKGKL